LASMRSARLWRATDAQSVVPKCSATMPPMDGSNRGRAPPIAGLEALMAIIIADGDGANVTGETFCTATTRLSAVPVLRSGQLAQQR
jgi:hypothetical protein